jgi:hypothetical protein
MPCIDVLRGGCLINLLLDQPATSTMSPVERKALRICVISCLIALTGFYLLHYWQQDVVQILTQLQHSDKEVFIETAIQTTIEGAFDKESIVDLCGNTTLTPGLIFQCDSPQGGVGNVENFFMNCVRFAIEAGGIDVKVPPKSKNQLT